ncbi:MAG: glutathione peroxidase [Bacteroidales bacterium]|nr:glutathione peroxidase [Bacteroidales bacterium]
MKNILAIFLFVTACSINGQPQQTAGFYDFTVKTIDHQDFDLSSLKGKKVMVVNTASKCGFTPQYGELEKLYKEYRNNNFIIIGFPANNFLNQEPGTDEEIENFCRINYGVTFPMMAKISVKGKDQHPLYQWLTKKSLNGVLDKEVKWNFQKFLIDENGRLVDVLMPGESPYSEKVIGWLSKVDQ